jgi:hypothetical protein
MTEENTKLIKELEDRLHETERLAIESEASIASLKTKLTNLNTKVADVILTSNDKQFHKDLQDKVNLELKTTLEMVNRKTRRLEDQLEGFTTNVEPELLKKMEDHQKVFQKHVRNYEIMKNELRARFGTTGGI